MLFQALVLSAFAAGMLTVIVLSCTGEPHEREQAEDEPGEQGEAELRAAA
jgi:hypothetical protein